MMLDDEVELESAPIHEEALSNIRGNRKKDYGSSDANLDRIAKMWEAWLDGRGYPMVSLNGHDVANMMILLKLSRESNQHKRDNIADTMSYAMLDAQYTEETDYGA